MPRDTRTYITLHDGMVDNRKIKPRSDKAFRTYVELLMWCSRERTDGVIPTEIFPLFGTPAARKELLAANLVEQSEEGFAIHDYLNHQRSRAEIEALSEKRRVAGSNGGRAKAVAIAKQDARKNLPETDTETDTYSSTDVEEKETKSEIAVAIFRPDVDAILDALDERIRANGAKVPKRTKANVSAARLLLDADGKTVDQVVRAIDWATTDEFWRSNILSMSKLRAKYDQLVLAAQRNPRPSIQRHQDAAVDLKNRYREDEAHAEIGSR